MSLWTIKEVIEIVGVTESALRYYNAKGILSPTKQETSGRRQWLYDDEAIRDLKKILLLRYMGVSMDDAKRAIKDDEIYRRTIIETLAKMKDERDKLDRRIFIAQVMEMSSGTDLITADEDLNESEATALNELIREYIKSIVE